MGDNTTTTILKYEYKGDNKVAIAVKVPDLNLSLQTLQSIQFSLIQTQYDLSYPFLQHKDRY